LTNNATYLKLITSDILLCYESLTKLTMKLFVSKNGIVAKL